MYPDLYPEGTIFREHSKGLELQVKNGMLLLTQIGQATKTYYSIRLPLGPPDNWEIITKESNFDRMYKTLKDGLS